MRSGSLQGYNVRNVKRDNHPFKYCGISNTILGVKSTYLLQERDEILWKKGNKTFPYKEKDRVRHRLGVNN